MSDEPRVLIEYQVNNCFHRLVWDGTNYRLQIRYAGTDSKWAPSNSVDELFTYLRQELNKR